MKKIFYQMVLAALKEQINSGKIGDVVNDLLKQWAAQATLPMMAPTPPVQGGPFKDLLSQVLLSVLQQLIASGQLTDILTKLLSGALGAKNLALPVTATECGDVEITEDGKLQFTHNDGSVHEVDLSELLG